MNSQDQITRVVVVGVDTSGGAKAALRFALEEARLREATLRAICAWQFPHWSASGFEGAPPAPGWNHEDFRDAAETALETALGDVISDVEEVEVERRVVEGPAAAVLIEESLRADLLVVGSRGLGGFAGLMLGSVSQQCAHHARCPVVIVPPHPEKSPEG
jgi:nucleotide-binding universal stress UspA family protein